MGVMVTAPDIATSLIRPIQHGKLDTLAWFDPIINDAQPSGCRPSPWDPPSLVGCDERSGGVVLRLLRPSLCAGLVDERDVVSDGLANWTAMGTI